MNQSALFTSLVSICLALMKTGQFSEEVLRRVFFNVDLSLAEVESGRTSIKEIERNLDKRMAADAIRK